MKYNSHNNLLCTSIIETFSCKKEHKDEIIATSNVKATLEIVREMTYHYFKDI